MKKVIFWTGQAIMVFILNSCDKEPTANTRLTELAVNYQKWKSAAAVSYNFVEARNCFCANAGPYSITVTNQAIISVKDANGQPVAFNNAGFKTIEELFEYAKTSLQTNPYQATIKYNGQYGYPESMYFDFSQLMADEEMGYTVSGFTK